MTHRRHRLDANHAELVACFKACGWSVWSTSQGQVSGAPDLVVAKAGRTIVVEVKPRTGKLRASQVRFLANWPGESAVVRSVDDVIALTKGKAA